jgi:ketosteroid isomerase-like protein
MSYPVRLGLLVLAVLVFTPSSLLAGDLEDVKAAFERAINAQRTLDAAGWVGTGHDEAIGYNAYQPIAVDTKVMGKNAMTKMIQAGYANVEQTSIMLVNPQYRVFGSTAVAWGHSVNVGKVKDGPQRMFYVRYTAAYAKIGGKWLAVSYHISKVPSDSWGD